MSAEPSSRVKSSVFDTGGGNSHTEMLLNAETSIGTTNSKVSSVKMKFNAN